VDQEKSGPGLVIRNVVHLRSVPHAISGLFECGSYASKLGCHEHSKRGTSSPAKVSNPIAPAD
jgi:hypothetical protein